MKTTLHYMTLDLKREWEKINSQYKSMFFYSDYVTLFRNDYRKINKWKCFTLKKIWTQIYGEKTPKVFPQLFKLRKKTKKQIPSHTHHHTSPSHQTSQLSTEPHHPTIPYVPSHIHSSHLITIPLPVNYLPITAPSPSYYNPSSSLITRPSPTPYLPSSPAITLSRAS